MHPLHTLFHLQRFLIVTNISGKTKILLQRSRWIENQFITWWIDVVVFPYDLSLTMLFDTIQLLMALYKHFLWFVNPIIQFFTGEGEDGRVPRAIRQPEEGREGTVKDVYWLFTTVIDYFVRNMSDYCSHWLVSSLAEISAYWLLSSVKIKYIYYGITFWGGCNWEGRSVLHNLCMPSWCLTVRYGNRTNEKI